MGRILALLTLVVDIITIIDIINGNKDTEKKVLWIVAVVFLPLLGPLLYFFLGRGRP
jgi:hypothetical protein